QLNNNFTEPLSESEIKAILRCVPKAIDKFIDYEQGLRLDEVKRVSKCMRDKGGYWYKNETLIERLGITPEEEKYLKTIISEQEKNRRNAEYKRVKRRNENGLTKKQQELKDLKREILKLKKDGRSNRCIAKVLKISESKVRTTLKH
ncbi:MAG: helix-turn-helix transcriptional regulator, partial [Sarcina sp.]